MHQITVVGLANRKRKKKTEIEEETVNFSMKKQSSSRKTKVRKENGFVPLKPANQIKLLLPFPPKTKQQILNK